jgi:1,2-diacylglycerol 3-beta-galactosyltransferase
MKQVAFLMSDTGGGHRAAGRALEAALDMRYPGMFETHYVDVFREYTFPPWKYAPELYPLWVKHSIGTYGLYFWFFDRVMELPLARNTLPTLIARDRMRQLVADYAPDILVVVHGAFSRFAVATRDALKLPLPVVTVITDMAKPHLGWYHPGVDRCLVPCEAAYQRGLKAGMDPAQMRITGHPAHPKFALYQAEKSDARRALGWPQGVPTALVLGGGEGMGEIEDIALAINARALALQLVIICGRNDELRGRLQAVTWNQHTHVLGFVDNIEVMMRAADVLITKAGPGTIAEAAISGLPMILSGAIPFQESPNIDFVVEHGAGVHAPSPEEIAATLRAWLASGDGTLRRLAAGTRQIAYPNASFDIADEIAIVCGVSTPA